MQKAWLSRQKNSLPLESPDLRSEQIQRRDRRTTDSAVSSKGSGMSARNLDRCAAVRFGPALVLAVSGREDPFLMQRAS